MRGDTREIGDERLDVNEVRARFTILLFIAITTTSFADANMVAPNLVPILGDFGFDPANKLPLGVLTFAYVLASAGAMVFFGILSDKYERKWVALAGCLTFSTFSVLTFWTPHGAAGYTYLFVVRVLNGFGVGAVVPTVFSLFGDLVPVERRGVVFSWFSVATLVGQALGNALAAGLFSMTGDWRTPFIFTGLANLAMSVLVLAVKEPARGRMEHALAGVIDEREGVVYDYTFHARDFRVLKERKSNAWLVANFVDTIPAAIILFLLYAYMEEVHNIPATASLTFLLVAGVGGAVGAVVGGAVGDKYFKINRKARVQISIFANLAPIPFVIVAFLLPFHAPDGASVGEILAMPGVVAFTALIFVALLLNGGVGPNWYSTLMDVNLPEHRGTMVAMANTMDQVGRAVAPLVGTWVATTFSTTAGILSSVFFWVALPFFWIPVLRHITSDLDDVDRILEKRASELQGAGSGGAHETREGGKN
ncbi:MAG: MFS transporter [Promethearchaeota archaeon]